MADAAARNKQDDLQPQQQAKKGGAGPDAMPGKARRGSPYKQNQATQFQGGPAMEAAGAAPAAPAAAEQAPDYAAMLEALKRREEMTQAEIERVAEEMNEDRGTIALMEAQLGGSGGITAEDLQRLEPMGLEAETPKQLLEMGITTLTDELTANEELLPLYDIDLQGIADERTAIEAKMEQEAAAGGAGGAGA